MSEWEAPPVAAATQIPRPPPPAAEQKDKASLSLFWSQGYNYFFLELTK